MCYAPMYVQMHAQAYARTKTIINTIYWQVVILGDGAVGKTSISMRFVEDYFATQYKQTLGVDWFIKRVVLPGQCT